MKTVGLIVIIFLACVFVGWWGSYLIREIMEELRRF
jgi:hypothetical protein